MRNVAFAVALLASAVALPRLAHADVIDDFVLTGHGNLITFSLPASPPGNHLTCPTGIVTACLPGSQTAFYLSAEVTTNGVTSNDGLAFPTGRFFGGGLSGNIGPDPGEVSYSGLQLFEPDAANPTFLTGTFSVYYSVIHSSNPADTDYTLTITPEVASAATPEPASLALLATGALGLLGLARSKSRHLRR
ncbi:MAG: PEP-CTERM sorting domain-containing protein [Acidobacteriota bacterium]|nr:PEP-CTERM sorting domain-containing protein [Acidobacteriota bacterium]